jgi:glycine hydroxymethyltransferase
MYLNRGIAMSYLSQDDPEVAAIINRERTRIENTIDLVAAENHCPQSLMEALGSVFNMKAAEGYPGNRFHAGCIHADEVETLAISRAKQLFGAEHVNVQPHSGVSANFAVYFSVLEPGDRVLAMKLSHGHRLPANAFNSNITAWIRAPNKSTIIRLKNWPQNSNPR